MEQELFFSGYCRCLDNSRLVEVIVEDGNVTEVDCSYSDCPYAPGCEIGKKITELSPK